MVDAGVHERSVVADDQDGSLVAGNEAAEPLNALEVEVVGGLVEEQQIGMAEEELGERDPHLPSARELGAGLIEVRDGKPEAREDLPRVALEFVASEPLKSILDLAVLCEQSLRYLPALPRLRDLMLQLLGA